MKNLLTRMGLVMVAGLALFVSGRELARAVGFTNPVINEAGLAYSKRFVLDLQQADVNTISATTVFSSAAFTSKTFSTGQVSTGSFTVADNTLLSSAAATNSIVVASTSGSVGDSIVVTLLQKPGAYVFKAGRDWNYKATTALTAASIKLALDTVPYLSTSRVSATLSSTSTILGANGNLVRVTVSNPSTLTLAHAAFTGGRNAASITVNGFTLQAGRDFVIGAAASNTATNIRAAINAKAVLSSQVTAAGSSADITIQSDHTGTIYNFPLSTSNSSAISRLHPTLIGGANTAWTLNTKNIAVTSHGFTLALPVLYSTGAGAPAIAGLTTQTTYYVIPVDANTIQLASSSGNAQAGTGIVLASSSTLTASKSYTLAPLAFTTQSGTGFKWQTSDNGSDWSDVSITSVTYSVPGSYAFDLGVINQRYLGLNVVAPATGGLQLSVTASGTFSN